MKNKYIITGIIATGLVGSLVLSIQTPAGIYPNITGAIATTTTDFCHIKTSTVRPPTSFTNSLKVQQLASNEDQNTKDYEEDHFIPITLNGCPDCQDNLWPEPYTVTWKGENLGAHEKDKVEVYLRGQVCSGKLTYKQAQDLIRSDWVKIYHQIKK